MTQNEIEHMWKVASNDPNHDTNWHDPVVVAFAQLVAQKEREECAKVCEGWDFVPGGHEFTSQQLTKNLTETIATCIRARGQA
jgi:hypothetical protein